MRLLLLISIAAALAAVGAVAYQFRPRGGPPSEPARAQTVNPAPAAPPIRSIPIRPKEGADPATAPAPTGMARDPKAPDVLDGVSATLDDLRKREASEGREGAAITPGQIDALKAQAERRRVRPVTRMAFPLEPGATVPAQVYLHPVPPELANLGSAADPLGFIQVGDKLVLVGTVSRRIVAVAKG